MTSSVLYCVHGSVAVLTLNNPPVNGISLDVRAGIVASVRRALEDSLINAIVLIGTESAFSSGADIRELGTERATQEPTLRGVIGTLEESPKPVIAAIGGVCMGGGLELALGCHFRVAKPDATIAFPEVKLGLLPGAGGTQRLPRATGLETALKMIVSGEPQSARELSGTALFDEIVGDDLQRAALGFAERLVSEERPSRRLRDIEPPRENARTLLAAARARALESSGGLPAPLKCVEAVAAAIDCPFDEGMRLERRFFETLLDTPQSKALRHVFKAERGAARIPGIPVDTPTRPIGRVGIVGAGTMGGGIAMSFLNANLPVVMLETSAEALDRGVANIRKSYETSLAKGRLTRADLEARLANLRTGLDYGELAHCDLIIEAVFESLEVKQQVFARLDASARAGAILASNTSTLDLNRIAATTRRPGDVIGLHFFSPAHVMRLLEVVRGEKTADDVLVTCLNLARRIKKIAVVSGVCDGFIGNRMLHKYQAAAEDLLVQGASPQQVDHALERFGMAMGPFRVGDLAGLDIGWAIRKHRAKLNPAGAVPRIADRLCEAGRFGQKTGAGWYRYELGKREPIPDPTVNAMIAAFRADRGVASRPVGEEEIVQQCVGALVVEGSRILDEGIALRASDIDVVWVNGYGFPRHRGGPMHHAREMGAPTVRDGA
ncbi:MAG TPA: 3-hydroxyacyl-CoA dehydrogenase NAD-binding domain-containing protein [Steroidobacteraceae bacterium]|nr:3-hydroxyacyl-CoA dehydrogenase NAD-binding domain-containing protein [Steroidobacteraceae bacterium]